MRIVLTLAFVLLAAGCTPASVADHIIGSIPVFWWAVIALGVSAALAAFLRVYFGSWRTALGAAGIVLGLLLTVGAYGRGRLKGRLAEREENLKAAQKRADKRKERRDEIKNLPDDALARRARRWVRDGKG